MKTFTSRAIALVLSFAIGASLAPTAALAITAAAKYELNNKMGGVARKNQLGTLIESAENSLEVLANGETILNGTDDTVEVASDDEAIVLNLEGFEAKAATLSLSADQGDDTADVFKLSVSTGDVLSIINGSTTLWSYDSAGVMSGPNGDLISNGTDDKISFESDDAATTVSAQGAEAQSGILQVCTDQCDDAGDKYSWTVATDDSMLLKNGTTTIQTWATTGLTSTVMSNGDTVTNATDDKLSFQSEDEASTVEALGFEAKNAILNLWADQGDDAGDKWSLTSDVTANGLLFKNDTTQVYALSSAGVVSYADSETLTDASDVMTFAFDDAAATVKVAAFEATASNLILQADESDDNGDDWQITSTVANTFTVSNDTSGAQVAKLTMTTAGAITLVGGIAGDGGDALKGFLSEIVAATSTTATIAQCGATFVGASDGNNTMVLPEASTALGCQYTFVCGETDDLVIDPSDGTDQIGSFLSYTAGPAIALIAPSAGDAVSCVSAGSQITIRAVANDLWVVLHSTGIITDTN